MKKNKDGSITLHFSPKKPKGVAKENWIQTNENEGFFIWFRTYSPTEAWYDKSWQMEDVKILSK
ncbi:DUF1214 domain-containing protein [Flammeovirga kamogawensis]|uniref:DUF1214 domain-containing protein n=1 Tax=Flammeovirga kamogawensis TaxID=373891 RepID=A0ABX8H017_9BACT|nr:DUF1214 domain-containing protein [Flammeovirga kamogawensis]TRX70088.1 DUF1214 domain-containing protein [Flammeovirga kamogawensis]